MTLQDKVNKALDAAVFENSYVELMSSSAREVAEDLCVYSREFEKEEIKNVIPCVEDYKSWFWAQKRST